MAICPRACSPISAGGFDDTAYRFQGLAPYWRLAYEKTWDKNSLMFGTFGMYADQKVGTGATASDGSSLFAPGLTDATLDVGVDTQYQWIGEEHIVTVRGAYIWQQKKNTIENTAALQNGAPLANASDQLNDLNISASYIYDRKYSFTAGYFSTWGTNDAAIYGSGVTPGVSVNGGTYQSSNGSPNSSGWNIDLAYLPYMKGGPDLWPWFNARIGIQYTHYDKFDGTWTNVDQQGLKAGGNDTVFLYTWLMF